MILLSKRTGNVTFRDGDGSIKVLVAGATLVVKSEKVANSLMKSYPGLVVEVDTEEASDDKTPKTPKGNKGNKNNKKEGGNNDDTTDPK